MRKQVIKLQGEISQNYKNKMEIESPEVKLEDFRENFT